MNGFLIFGIIAIYLLICVAFGLMRKLAKARFRAVTIAFSAIAAVITTLIVKNMFVDEAMINETLVPMLGEMGAMLQASPTLISVLQGMMASLLAPILCVLFFAAYSFLTWIVYVVLTIIFRSGMKEHNKRSRLALLRAGLVALAQGLIVVIIVMVPITGYAEMVGTLSSAVAPSTEQTAPQASSDEPDILGMIADINKDPAVVTFRALGAAPIADVLMTFEVNGVKANLNDELSAIMTFVNDFSTLSATPMEEYGEEEAQVYLSIADSFDKSALLPAIMGEFLHGATDAWLQGKDYAGMEKPTMGENDLFTPFMDEMLTILHEDSQNLPAMQADFRTLASVIAIFAENGVFANMGDSEDMMGALSAEGVVGSLIDTLGANPSMKRLIPQITNLGIRAIGQSLGLPENTAEVYNDLLADITDALNEVRGESGDTQVEALSEKLDAAFDKAGVTVDDEILNFYSAGMAADLLENNTDEVTTDDVQAFFLVYADHAGDVAEGEGDSASKEGDVVALSERSDRFAGTVYEGKTEEELAQSAASSLASLCKTLSAIPADASFAEQAKIAISQNFGSVMAGDESIAALLNASITKPISTDSVQNTTSLRGAEYMKTCKITMDQLLVDPKDAAALISAENLANETTALKALFTAAEDLLGKKDSDINISSIAEQVGGFLNSLKQTETFGSDRTANLFVAIFQSETIRDAANMDVKTATQMASKVQGGDTNYQQTLVSISKGVDAVEALSDENKEVSDAELKEMIENLTPQTAAMMEIYITPARMESFGAPASRAEACAELMVSMFTYMGNEELENYDAEAKALNQVLNLAMAAKEDDDSKLFSTEGQEDGRLPTERETIDTLMSSSAFTYAAVEMMKDGDRVDPLGLKAKVGEDGSEGANRFLGAVDAYRADNPDADPVEINAMVALFGF